jgi:hypothetical protein
MTELLAHVPLVGDSFQELIKWLQLIIRLFRW